MRIDLPDDLGTALTELARLDGIATEERVRLVVTDYLTSMAGPLGRACEALRAIGQISGVGDGAPPSPEPTPDTAPDTDDQEVDDDPGPVTADHPGGGRSGGEGPPPATYLCPEPGCAFVATSKQQLGGHRGSHRRRRKPPGCQLDDCDASPVKSRGLCAPHYRAWEDGRLDVAPDGAPSPSTEVGDTGHVCDDCGQTFKSAAGLGSHRRSHTRTPAPRSCDNCDETVAKGEPLRHGRCKRCDAYWRHHGEERPKPDVDGTFPCPDCGEPFDTAAGVGVHRGRYCPSRAGRAPQEEDPRPAVVLPPTTKEREQLSRQGANTHCIDCDAEPLGGGMRCHSCFTKARTATRGRWAS